MIIEDKRDLVLNDIYALYTSAASKRPDLFAHIMTLLIPQRAIISEFTLLDGTKYSFKLAKRPDYPLILLMTIHNRSRFRIETLHNINVNGEEPSWYLSQLVSLEVSRLLKNT